MIGNSVFLLSLFSLLKTGILNYFVTIIAVYSFGKIALKTFRLEDQFKSDTDPAAFLIGQCLIYGVFLLTLRVSLAWWFSLLPATLVFLPVIWKKFVPKNPIYFLVLSSLLLLLCCFGTINATDARSIWFFHGKIFHYLHGEEMLRYLATPSIAFSHPDYPQIVPFFSAFIMTTWHDWSECFPKAAVAIFWIPVFLAIPKLEIKNRALLYFMVLVLGGGYFWNGQMDWLLAVYFVMGVLILYRKVADPKLGFLFLLTLPLIKNEGLVLTILGLSFYSWRELWKSNFKTKLSWLLLALPFIASLLVWKFWQSKFGIQNDLAAAGPLSTRMMPRLKDSEAIFFILKSYFYAGKIFIYLLGPAIVWRVCEKRKWTWSETRMFFPVLAYALVLIIVYLSTPYDLNWHIRTSMDRTTLPIFFLLVTILMIQPTNAGNVREAS